MSVQTIEYMTCEQTREYDQNAIKKWHVPSIVLMENAGRNLAALFILFILPFPTRLTL